MNVSEFYKYLENTNFLNSSTLQEFNEVIKRYPYFQMARMLYLKNLYIINDDSFRHILEKNSIFLSDRKALYQFINENNIVTENVEQPTFSNNNENKTLTNEVSVSTKNIENTSNQNTFSDLSKNKTSIADEILNKIEQIKSSKPTQDINVKYDEKANFIEEKPTENISKQETRLTFDEWIQYISTKTNIVENFSTKPNTEPDIIEKFLTNADNLERIKPLEQNNNIDLTESLAQPEELEIVSENLAKLYYQQGHYEKAIKLYEKLILKYPEKSIYFASLIQEIKQKIDKN